MTFLIELAQMVWLARDVIILRLFAIRGKVRAAFACQQTKHPAYKWPMMPMFPQILVLAIVMALAGPARAAETFALVVAADDYEGLPDLDGAVNDARDIAAALARIDADVTMLLDENATRAAVLAGWRALAAKATAGDRLIFAFAGHGSNEPQHFIGSEVDGRDEVLLLPGFRPRGASAQERLRDDDIAMLIAETPELDVIVVTDASHGPDLSRDIRPALGYRFAEMPRLRDDPLDAATSGNLPNDGRDATALYLTATLETGKTPEFLIDGRPRGALSHAFANGLRGAADADGDYAITRDEMVEFVRRAVRSISQGVQVPQAAPQDGRNPVLFRLDANAPPPPVNVFALPFTALPRVSLTMRGGTADDLTTLSQIEGVQLIDPGQPADLGIDLDAGLMRTMVGDTIRDLGPVSGPNLRDGVQEVVDRMRVARALELAAIGQPLEVRFQAGDRTYRQDDHVTVQVDGRRTRYISLFNVSSDGEVDFLYPLRGDGIDDPAWLPREDQLNLTMRVIPPFGADHIIAFETLSQPEALHAALTSANDRRDIRDLWKLLRAAGADAAQPPRVAIFPFYTTRE